MRVLDIWKSKQKPTFSFELYPARTPKGASSLERAIDELAELEPDFVSVTFGAGGSTWEGSRDLVDALKNGKGLEIVAYVACYGLQPEVLTDVLRNYQKIGVENVLGVRGDPPREQENFTAHTDSFSHASDFIQFIKQHFDLCVGAAGYPEGHIEAESKEKDLEYLKLKVNNGAEYIIANYFYDNNYFFRFLDRCDAMGISVPVVPGVMPVFSVKMMKTLAELCGATITEELEKRIAAVPEGDKEGLRQMGVDFAVEQCSELLDAGVPGIHIYTMDRSASAAEIVKRLRADSKL